VDRFNRELTSVRQQLEQQQVLITQKHVRGARTRIGLFFSSFYVFVCARLIHLDFSFVSAFSSCLFWCAPLVYVSVCVGLLQNEVTERQQLIKDVEVQISRVCACFGFLYACMRVHE
jgi:hypothetical protein